MHEDLHKLHHFNYFTVDFNEEFSGLYGGVLNTQSDYVVAALQAIQKLYSSPKKVGLLKWCCYWDNHGLIQIDLKFLIE